MSRARVEQLLGEIDKANAMIANANAEIRRLMNGAKPASPTADTPAMPTATAIPLGKVRVGGVNGPEGEWGLRIADPPPRDQLVPGMKVMKKLKDGRTFPQTIARCIEYVENEQYPYAVCITKKETPPEQWGEDVPF